MSDSTARALALRALQYKEEHRSGSYPDIANKPKLNNVTINGNHNSAYYKLPLLAETGHSITFSSDSEFNLTIELLNKAGDVLSTASLDLPLESMVMDGHYKETSEGKWLVLDLQNGKNVEIPLEDLIDELATKEYVNSLYEDLSKKLDSEANIREEQVIILNARLDSEAQVRFDNDTLLANSIHLEKEARIAGDSELKNLLNSEAIIRENQFTDLQSQLNSEVDLRDEQYLELTFLIDSEGHTREEQLSAFKDRLDKEVIARIAGDSELQATINLETFNRTQGDLELQHKLDSEATIRANKDAEIENLLGQEAATRSSQDIALSNRIDQKQDIITTSTPLVKLGNTIQLNYDPNTLRVEDNALKVIGGGSSVSQAFLNGVLLDSEADSISAKIYWYGTQSEYNALDSEAKNDPNTLFFVEDSEGRPIIWTKSYYELEDKPAINGITLSGDKTLSSLGIQPTLNGSFPVTVNANVVSLKYNESQFEVDSNGKFNYIGRDDEFTSSLTWTANWTGLTGLEVNKFNDGLYAGTIRFLNREEVAAGTHQIATGFGDNGHMFNFYSVGFDDRTHTPFSVECTNGDVYIHSTITMPARSFSGFTFTSI